MEKKMENTIYVGFGVGGLRVRGLRVEGFRG